MNTKEITYCLVCQHYDLLLNKCKLNYKSFCNMKDFEPSFTQTILNFLDYANKEDYIDTFMYNVLVSMMFDLYDYKTKERIRNENNTD